MIKAMKGLAQQETKALQSAENTSQGDYQMTKIPRAKAEQLFIVS